MIRTKTKRAMILLGVSLLIGAGIAGADWDPEDGFKMHYPQFPDSQGWDVCFRHLLLADDFECSESGEINDIHFWIAWRDDVVDLHALMGWDLSIWSDDEGQPGRPLWRYRQATVQYRDVAPSQQGWLCPCGQENCLQTVVPNSHATGMQVNLIDIEEPFYQEQGKTYWLVIRAMIPVVADRASPQGGVGGRGGRGGARITGIIFLVELSFLKGRQRLAGYRLESLIQY